MEKQDYLNERFGDLVVARDLGNDTFHAVCEPQDRECGRYRTVTRRQLSSHSVHQCKVCAKQAKQHRKPKPKPVPIVELVKVELPPCVGCELRIVDRRPYLASQPDCPRHGLSGVNLNWPPRREREAIVGWGE